jgi:hypothetical protein
MDKLEGYRHSIKSVFNDYAAIPYAHGDLQCEAVFDEVRDRYLLVTVGWDRDNYVHFTLAHIDVADGKLWTQCDRTEEGIADELVAAGVPKEDIVLGFKSERMRQDTEFAVA